MAKSIDDYIDDALFAGASDKLRRGMAGLAEIVQDLEQAGVTPKAKAPESDADKATSEAFDISPIIEKTFETMATLMEAQAALDADMQALKEHNEAVTKERDKNFADYETRLKEIGERIGKVEGFISDTPNKARDARESNINNKDAQRIKEQTPSGEYDPFYGPDAKVPISGGGS